MTTPEFNPFVAYAESEYPEITRETVIDVIKAGPFGEQWGEIQTVEADPYAAYAMDEELSWVITVEDGLCRIECVYTTESAYADVVDALRACANDTNAQAVDGRAFILNNEGDAAIEGDACFHTTPALSPEQLDAAVHHAIAAAHQAVDATIEVFNQLAGGE